MRIKIFSIVLVFAICLSLCFTTAYAASPEDVDCTHFPFDEVPYPSDYNESYVDYTNLALFYYDYNLDIYYASYTTADIILTSSIELDFDDTLEAFTSGNIYVSETDSTPYQYVTLTYTLSDGLWAVGNVTQGYLHVTGVTSRNDVLSYDGEVVYSYVVEDNTSTEEDEATTKKWYDYIIDSLKDIFFPMIGWFEDAVAMSEKFIELFALFTDIENTITEKTGSDNILKPVTDFFAKITNTTVDLLMPFADFAGMRDMLMVAVIVLLFGGIFKFCFGG